MENRKDTEIQGSLSPERPIKVRCPECLRLYSVDPTEISESKPRFECVSCNLRFWLAYPESLEQEEIIGFPMDWLEKNDAKRQYVKQPQFEPTAKFSCPKCEAPYLSGQKECRGCGLVFAKFYDPNVDGTVRDSELETAWQLILDHYEDELRHEAFFKLCLKKNQLEYLAKKYGKLLDAYSGDEIALKARDRVTALYSSKLDQARNEIPRARQRQLPFFSIILLLGGAVIALGFVMPAWRNLVGIGASMLFLTIAIRLYFRSAFE